MRFVFLFAAVSVFHTAFADWIQPPLTTESGYRVPQPDYEPQFPDDHGAHPGHAIEWWYWVGHLEAVDGSREFGFQSTVFRLEGDAKTIQPTMQQQAPFGSQQLFMAHVALSDFSAGRYLHTERVFREGWQARASTETLDLEVGPIIAGWNAAEGLMEKELALPEGRQLRIRLRPLKPLVVFGERGISRKGNNPAAVSWYWTYTRLAITGVLIEGDRRTEVSGTGWMDHEVSSSQLSRNQVGWDWAAIQLDDGTEVKVYRLRTNESESDPWSPICWIDSEGGTTRAYAKDFDWKTDSTWKSDLTGNRYPNEVTIRAVHPDTGKEMIYRLRPLLDAQEFVGNRASNAYWEGGCAVFDGNNRRIGKAYLELVGYGGSIADQLRR
jgi:predicted secreted hydrolase